MQIQAFAPQMAKTLAVNEDVVVAVVAIRVTAWAIGDELAMPVAAITLIPAKSSTKMLGYRLWRH